MTSGIKNILGLIKECSIDVVNQLGEGWSEEIYQKAMEVALRKRGISYETQRILPITFSDHVIGDSIPDLVVWTQIKKQKIAIVIDLKASPSIKGDHKAQVERYIKELRKQLRPNENVYQFGFVINFIKESVIQTSDQEYVDLGKVEIMKVKV